MHNISKIQKCYKNLMESDPNNPNICEEFGDYLGEIGLYEKAKK